MDVANTKQTQNGSKEAAKALEVGKERWKQFLRHLYNNRYTYPLLVVVVLIFVRRRFPGLLARIVKAAL